MHLFIRLMILLGCALLNLNLVGSDPSDVIFAIATALILSFAPDTILLRGLRPAATLTLAVVACLYAISCAFGWRSPSFVLYFVSGILLTISVYWVTHTDDRFPIGAATFGGFVLLSFGVILLWFVGIWPDKIFFDLFRDGRFMGPAGDPNMSGLLGSLALFFFLDRAVRASTSRLAMALTVLGGLSCAMIILASGSRSAWAATAAGLAVYFLASRRSFGLRTVTLGFVVAIAAILASMGIFESSGDVESVSDRFRSIIIQDQSAEQERFGFVYTKAALAVAADHPLGIGPGMTPFYTGMTSIDGDLLGAHNSYVEILTENGWITAALLFGLLSIAWFRLYHLTRFDIFYNDISCRVLLAGLSATAIFGMGHDLLAWRVGWILPVLAILAGFSCRFEERIGEAQSSRA
jgi:O-antigen ligase